MEVSLQRNTNIHTAWDQSSGVSRLKRLWTCRAWGLLELHLGRPEPLLLSSAAWKCCYFPWNGLVGMRYKGTGQAQARPVGQPSGQRQLWPHWRALSGLWLKVGPRAAEQTPFPPPAPALQTEAAPALKASGVGGHVLIPTPGSSPPLAHAPRSRGNGGGGGAQSKQRTHRG